MARRGAGWRGMIFGSVISALALLVLTYRLFARPAAGAATNPAAATATPGGLVSIVVPARNEAANIERLVRSLHALRGVQVELWVVDDESDDATAQLAEAAGARVVRGTPRPAGWTGKTWACWQGAERATGQYLLFTDADTVHTPDGLGQALCALDRHGLGLLSAPPFHRTERLWERLVGPFHALMLCAMAYRQAPRPARLFAIGQYLLFRREAYAQLGGHAAVRDALAEDVALAELALERGVGYGVHHGPRPYEVRMYATPAEFLAGWRRILRWGTRRASPLALGEMALTIGGLLEPLGWPALALAAPCYAAFATLFALAQRRLGAFSIWGALLYPLSVALFCALTLLSLVDSLTGREQAWRGRRYGADPK